MVETINAVKIEIIAPIDLLPQPRQLPFLLAALL